MNKRPSFRLRAVRQKEIATESKHVFVFISVIAIMILIGDFLVFAYIENKENWIIVTAMLIFLIALLPSMVLGGLPFEERYSRAGRALAIPAALSFSAVALPSFGDSYVSATALCILLACVLIFWQDKKVGLKMDGVPRVSFVLLLIVLPIALAVNELVVVGSTVVSHFMQGPPLWFMPVAALFGYLEEILFRGGVQQAIESVREWRSALIIGALLDAGLMAFWGSVYVIVFTFVVAVIMGLIFHKYSTASLCGLIRAVDGLWFVLIFYYFGSLSLT